MKLPDPSELWNPTDLTPPDKTPEIAVALLTGGGDRPYAFGLATALVAKGAAMDLIGSDDLDFPEFQGKSTVRFLNFRGNQNSNVTFLKKTLRVFAYYVRLIWYAATAKPGIFHILWNNKFQTFDRTLLMLYYRLLGKKIVLTVHNVNIGKRDAKDSVLNRLTLRIQYRLTDHLFVHTDKMKLELAKEFGVRPSRITVIPFGINNSIPNTSMTPAEAKQRLQIRERQKVLLFFGNIAPYKGLEYLVRAFQQVTARSDSYVLIIAGAPKNCEEYWLLIRNAIRKDVEEGRILLKAVYISDEETEVYFKAADVLVLPYTHVYQSGVLFLAHSFGLPVIAADVGSLKDDIVEGKTGFVFRSEDPVDLARAIENYFASDLYPHLDSRRQEIHDHAASRHSWETVSLMTMSVYATLLKTHAPGGIPHRESSKSSLDVKTSS